MTRLTEALAKARGESAGPEEVATRGRTTPSVVPGAWSFDADSGHEPDLEPKAAPPSANPSPAAPAASVTDSSGAKARPGEEVSRAVEDPFAHLTAIETLVVGPHPNNALVEQYRHLAAALHHAQLRTGARTVMVASAVEAEGKTTTAANIALTLSESHQRKVLLIDADLRRPSVHSLFHLDNRSGLSDTLTNISPDARVPLHKITPTLSIITAGKPTQDPMSALVSDMMREFLAEAAEQYDWVVIDTPPVALLSDANLLAAMVDLALLVVSASTTPYPLVKRAADALGQSKILGVVLNRAQRSELAAGYAYYGYSYTYSADVPRKKKGWFPFGRNRQL